MSEEPYNFLAIENGVNIIDCTSQVPNCPAKNMLSTDRKAIWLSCQGLPQGFTIDLSNQIKRPKLFSCFGFDCWHDYSSNPSMIELLASTDGEEFITWANIHPELRAGVQLFEIDPLATRYNFLKVVVRETYGAPKTYINQIFLFEENPLKKAVNTSKVNESINLNASDAVAGRRSATMGDVHFNENFHETLGQRHTTGSHMKPKQERRQSGNDFNFLQFYEQSKDEDVSIDHQRNSLAKPPTPTTPMGYSNSMPKLSPQVLVQQQQQQGNRGHHPHTQRNAVSMSYSNFPTANQFQGERERPGNISHDMINPGHRRSEYNQGPLTPQPKSSSGGAIGMIANQQKTYSNNPSPVLGRNQHYFPDQFDSTPQNSKPVTPLDHHHHQNESFVSLLNDQISSMNDEVKKMVHNSGIKGGRDTYKPQAGTKSSTEEDDLGFPLLTHSEKEVKQMKIEMNKWSGMMMGLQENMSRLLQKVSDMQTGMDTAKTKSTHYQHLDMLDTAKTVTENHPTFQSINPLRKGSIESMPSTDSFETLRAKITNYLENVISQNQVIIQENQKLRQNMDSVRRPSPSKHEYNEASQHFSSVAVPQYQDIEKIVSELFEKNMKSWKKTIEKEMREEIEERFNQEVERLHDQDRGFKEKISREMQELKIKVSYFEQQNNMNMAGEAVKNIMKSRSDKAIQEDTVVPPLRERKMNNQNASKENIDYYQNNNVSVTTTSKKVSSSKDIQKKQQPVVENEKPSLNSSTHSLAKIQHLMEKLNEKIALRDQKVQELQNQEDVSSIADSDILDTSKDELAESLFAQKARYNNVSNRKKIMK